jgi:multidrug efflux pump
LEQGRAVKVSINRDVAARLGISTATIDRRSTTLGQRIISTISRHRRSTA